MGDRVERALEETVPLLRTIRKLKLLTEEEVRTIVQKRRDHEYALRRPGAPRILFLRYAAFEKELTELLQARAVDRNIPEKRARNIAGQQSARVNLVYSRAIRKFKGDDQLYLHYARHCIDAGSRKAADKVLARAIAHRGDSEKVWLAAIAFHFDSCGDAKVARALAQRALRALKTSKLLWKEYFRLELTYLAKLIARRITIGTEIPGRTADPALNVRTLDGNQSSSSMPCEDPEAQEKASDESIDRLSFWEGGVPLAVLRRACDTACLSYEDVYEYYDIATSIKLTPPELFEGLRFYIEEGFTDLSAPLQAFIRLQASYNVASATFRKQRAINLASTATEKERSRGSVDGTRLHPDAEGLQMSSVDSEEQNLAATKLAAHAVVNELEGSLSKACRDYYGLREAIRCFVSSLREDLDDNVAGELCMRCEDVLLAIGRQDGDIEQNISVISLQDVSAKSCPRAWARFLSTVGVQAFDSQDKATLVEIREHVRRGAAVPIRNRDQEAMCIAWLEWEREVDCLRTIYDLLLEMSPLTGNIIVAAIDAELRLLSANTDARDAPNTFKKIRTLYSKGLLIPSLASDVEFWLRYVRFERDIVKNASNAATVQWKARHALSKESIIVFDERVMLLNVS